jgi:hypothetical protein
LAAATCVDARRYGRAVHTNRELGEAGSLAYRSAGRGRPLVLLHAGAGLDQVGHWAGALQGAERVRERRLGLTCRPVVARLLEETAA